MAMCSKSFYSALLWGANLTSNTLETLRMEGSAFRISLFFHATPNFEEYYKLTYVFFLSKIFFQFLYGNFCRKDKFFKKKEKCIYILILVSINHQFEMTFCATVVERSTYLYSIKLMKHLQSLAV